jgi:uncharacterized membrane protein YphA (DoxX/SURF4 family)
VNTVLWIVTALLAVVFAAVGLMKLSRPKPALVTTGQGWAEDVPDAVGLLLPALLDTATVLEPLAAVGLAVLMVGPAVTHAHRREYPNIAVNLVLAALAVFIAVQRFGPHPC